jgi:tetratricopeptide (TPR) repeat protein
MASLGDLFRYLDTSDPTPNELMEPIHFDPFTPLEKSASAKTEDSINEAIQLIDVQLKNGAAALRAAEHEVLIVHENFSPNTDTSVEAIRGYLHDLHVTAYDLQSRIATPESGKYHLVKAAACKSDKSAAKLRLVEFYINQRRYRDAIATLSNINNERGGSAFALFTLASLLLDRGAVDEAREAIDSAEARDNVGLIQYLCRIRRSMIEHGILEAPGTEILNQRYTSAGNSLLAGDRAEALKELMSLAAVMPRWASVWFFIGFAHRVGRDGTHAIDEIKATKNRAEGPVIFFSDVTADEHRQTELLRAVEAYRIALSIDPTLAAASNELTVCLLWLQRADEALIPALNYVASGLNGVEAYANLSAVFLAVNDRIRAERIARRALNLDPENPVAQLTLLKIHNA